MIDGWMVECHVRLRSKCIDHDYSNIAQESDEGNTHGLAPMNI